MGIEITRIQDLRIDIDYGDIYVHASLLDRTQSTGKYWSVNVNWQNMPYN